MRLALLMAFAGGVVVFGQAAMRDRNPVSYAPESVARGKSLYLQNCQSCHDEDGRARSAAVAIAADLTDPSRWKFGTSDGQLFKTIKDGAAEAMPPFGVDLKDPQIWDVVNFIRTLSRVQGQK